MKKVNYSIKIGLTMIIFTIIALACASSNNLDYTKYVRKESFSIPSLDTVTTVSVGDALLKQGSLVKTDAIQIKKDSLDGVVKKGIYRYDGKDKNGNKMFRPVYNSGAEIISTPNQPFTFIVYGPIKQMVNDKWVEVGKGLTAGFLTGINTMRKGSKFIPDTDYEMTEIIAPEENSFQQTLLYTGRENNIIKFSYREFSDDMARPSFTVDVQYDLNQSKEISFRQAKIEVIKATNSSITYKVLSNFN
ncbi:hypothetical protein [Treponema sp.]|uniref:hypothetical protein n=1 Tax=Treponema sp. TaxID=166 RepID=UPI00298E2E8A|nr:hypothetical protein [Treponema sp.]MCR5613848.1 hypothetical protein [Treponema sp.]